MCDMPGCNKPVYTDGSGRAFNYCGRTHALLHKAQSHSPPSQVSSSSTQNASNNSIVGNQQSGNGRADLSSGASDFTRFCASLIRISFGVLEFKLRDPNDRSTIFFDDSNPFGLGHKPSVPIAFDDGQGLKFTSPTLRHLISSLILREHFTVADVVRVLPSARASFDFFRTHKELVRPDWQQVKVDVMRQAVIYFSRIA